MFSSDVMKYNNHMIPYLIQFFSSLLPFIFYIMNDARFHRYRSAINDVGFMYFNNYSTRYLSSKMEIGRRRAESKGKSRGASSFRRVPRRDDD